MSGIKDSKQLQIKIMNYINFKKNKVTIFFFSSIFALIIFPFLIFTINRLIWGNTSKSPIVDINQYLETLPYDTNDPYITRVPTLKNLLDGPIISTEDPTLGSDTAPITIVQFSDFNCRFCQEQFIILKKIIAKYSSENKIRFIRKDYPESDIGSASYKSAIAARCAQEQNKFWEFHDLLYEKSTTLNRELFINISKQIDLNQISFINCLDNSTNARTLIKNNVEEANALDINGVPFIYINKQEFIGSVSEESFEKVIQSQLEIQSE